MNELLQNEQGCPIKLSSDESLSKNSRDYVLYHAAFVIFNLFSSYQSYTRYTTIIQSVHAVIRCLRDG